MGDPCPAAPPGATRTPKGQLPGTVRAAISTRALPQVCVGAGGRAGRCSLQPLLSLPDTQFPQQHRPGRGGATAVYGDSPPHQLQPTSPKRSQGPDQHPKYAPPFPALALGCSSILPPLITHVPHRISSFKICLLWAWCHGPVAKSSLCTCQDPPQAAVRVSAVPLPIQLLPVAWESS